MTSVWQLPALVGAILAWLGAPPTSLADVAKHEAVRRALTPPSVAIYTNDDLPAMRPSDIPPSEARIGEGDPGAAIPPATDQSQARKTFPAFERPPDDAVPAAGDEAGWRSRVAALMAAADRDRTLAAGLQSRVLSLQNEVLRRDDPAQRAQLTQELAKTLSELDKMTATVQKNQIALDELREDARRRGVPPGWIRPQ